MNPFRLAPALFFCILFWTATLNAQTPTQCVFLDDPVSLVSTDYDTITLGNPAPPPYLTSFSVFTSAFGSIVDVTTNMEITICFWGDMNNSDETFDVIISGQTFSSGGFLHSTSQGSPKCIIFNVNKDSVQSDLADGDIDISYANFGNGWTVSSSDPTDEFNADVTYATFDYQVNLTITSPSDACQDGTDVTWTATPAPGTQTSDEGTFIIYPSAIGFTDNSDGTATLDISEALPGNYYVEYTYTVNGCRYEIQDSIEIFRTPFPDLMETFIDCVSEGDSINLSFMKFGATSEGTFSSPDATIVNNRVVAPAGGGCFQIIYTADNPNGCSNAPYFDTAHLLITIAPEPDFSISDPATPICSTDGVEITLTNNSDGPNPELTINDDPAMFDEVILLAAPTSTGAISYEICYTETIDVPMACDTMPESGYEPCTGTICRTITVYNDGVDCGANAPFLSECPPDPNAHDPCPISVTPQFEIPFGCELLNTLGNLGSILIPNPAIIVNLLTTYLYNSISFDAIQAEVTPELDLVFCADDSVDFFWQGSFPFWLGGDWVSQDQTTIADIAPPVSGIICTIITFEICIPIPVVSDVCFDPLPLGPLEDMCDQTIAQFISSFVGQLIGGDGGGGIVVADTDGDGAFDLVVDQYFFPAEDNVKIPNNVTTGNGTITIRNVAGYPSRPTDVCGDVTADVAGLLGRFPWEVIPYVGGVIEALLGAADCDFYLTFTNEETAEIQVVNNQPPVFANCDTTGYVFSEDLICDTEVNWSVPVAFDGCNGEVLSYKGRTAGTDDTNYSGVPPQIVTVDESGLYQTAGPIPGSDLPPGTYSVTYGAYSCGGIEALCTFPVVVSAGDPELACPADITARTDVDQCDAIVTGLTPLQGIGCATIIDYAVDYPEASGYTDVSTNTTFNQGNLGTHNDASGLAFPLDTSIVTYTMMVDINGDGDIDDANEVQTCSFSVIVVDMQNPIAECIDLEVQLDNTGIATVYAIDQFNGSPFIDGGSSDNCDSDPLIEVAKANQQFGDFITFDCSETGHNFINLRVTDEDGNMSNCLAQVHVVDFFEGFEIEMDVPELCLEANNPVQLDFSNYMTITLPNGQTLNHNEIAGNAFMGDAVGAFGITAFAPHPGSASVDPGTVTPDGEYMPGTGTGYITISYGLALPDAVVPQNGDLALAGCFEIVHETFELRQPLEIDTVECVCVDELNRLVDLGVISGGLEPYTIQYSGVALDVDSDGFIDDTDGEYTYNDTLGHDIHDFMEDLGELQAIYTIPVWSFTIVDARGCELFRSGSCDTYDLLEGPEIDCVGASGLTTEVYECESQHSWFHAIPTDNCHVIIYNYRIINPDGTIEGPFDLSAILYNNDPVLLAQLLEAEYEFEFGTSTISYYAEDAVGLHATCEFEITVLDDDPPYFTNCPRPPVIENAEFELCEAYVNFSWPLAEDNCDMPTVTQIDNTGLTSGDAFPVGSTVLLFEAEDNSGNTTQCSIRVVVNDLQFPEIGCIGNVTVDSDPWKCGAVVDSIAPLYYEDNCLLNSSIAYKVEFPDGTDSIISSGVTDASGSFFPVGVSKLTYRVADQPILLITEVTQEIGIPNGGMNPAPFGLVSTDDVLEITNFGPGSIDLGGLEVERFGTIAGEIVMIPNGTIIPNGGVLTIHFGPGTDDPANLFFNVPTAIDIDPGIPAGYLISFLGEVLDVITTNGYDPAGNAVTGTVAATDWTGTSASIAVHGGLYRQWNYDSNLATDFAVADLFNPLTIGAVNPELGVIADNGHIRGLQSVIPNTATCSLLITVEDNENPFCGEFIPTTYGGGSNLGQANSITEGTLFQSIIMVGDNNIVGDVVLNNVNGVHPEMGDLIFRLTSPEGTHGFLMYNNCLGTAGFDITFFDSMPPINCPTINTGVGHAPIQPLSVFFGEETQGVWTLSIADTGNGNDGQLDGWFLTINAIENYSQTDVTLPNEEGVCEAEYTWRQPRLIDNCCADSIVVKYITQTPPQQPIPGGPIVSGTMTTQVFEVGTTTVRYILTDCAGNVDSCSFNVTVEDVEDPFIYNCPNDVTINLDPGDCGVYYHYNYLATDNCHVDTIIVDPPDGTYLPIGITTITAIAYDSVGNTFTCQYTVEVIGYDPQSGVVVCNDTINVSLGPDCTAEITADMLLEGNDYPCYDDFCIEILDENGNAIPDNTFTLDHVGQTFIATVTSCMGNGNYCSTAINVEHKVIPEIECPPDIALSCNAVPDTVITGRPIVLTCESGVSYSYDDEITDFDNCDSIISIIERTWTITNDQGYSTTCVQQIRFETVDLSDVVFPENFDDIDNPSFNCADVGQDPGLIHHSNTGVPTIFGKSVYDEDRCMISISRLDDNYYICNGGYEILRSWKIRNMCLPVEPGVNPIEHIQVIKVLDNTRPEIDCPVNITVSTEYDACHANVLIPRPDITDACSQISEFIIESSEGDLSQVDQDVWLLANLEIGTTTVTFTAIDACGNLNVCSYEITVVDDVVPVALCDQSTNVTLGIDGTALVYWWSLEDGSYDNCGIKKVQARRVETPPSKVVCDLRADIWRDYVKFCCEDVGETIMVEIGIWDMSDNFNSCWVSITVEAKLPPSIVAPPDITISCAYEFDLWDLSVFGTVETDASLIDEIYTDDYEFFSKCLNGQGTNPIFWGQDGFAHGTCDIEVVENYNENLECGTGVITRVFKATSGSKSKTAVQKITIVDCSPFAEDDINWPRDYTSSSCYAVGPHHGPHPDDLPAINGWPTFDEEDNCSLVAATYEDQVFQFVDSACWKVIRTWSVIDWCQYDADDPYSGGYWQYTQIIKLKNTVRPAFDPCEDMLVCTDNVVDCTGYVELPSNVTDDCTPYESLEISWKVDVFVDGTYDIFSTQPGMTYDDASGYYPFGTHRIFWNVEDMCGNTNTCSFLFTVEDCKLPTPYCYNGLATVVMPAMQTVDIWANDFDAGSFDNCCAPENLIFRMIRSADNPNNVLPVEDNNPATAYPTGMTLTCDDVADVSTVVQIWVGDCGKDRNLNGVIEDNERNWDYCETYVLVQDPNGVCGNPTPVGLFGDIETEEEVWIESVQVNLKPDNTGLPTFVTSTIEGRYQFGEIPFGIDCTVSAEKDGDDLNGVNTYDLILIQKHILGLQTLDSYYKYIAADANDDDRISALDIIDLRKLILGIYDDLPDNQSWRFADATYDFDEGIWNYPEEVIVQPVPFPEIGVDFTGIKIGDVDGSVQANVNNVTEERGKGLLELEIEDVDLEIGKEYEIMVSSENFNAISGMQWTIERTGIEITEIIGEGLDFNSQNYAQIERGGNVYTTLSWNDQEAMTKEGGLFTLRVLALQDGRLSEMLHLNSAITKSEAYREGGERIEVALKWAGLAEEVIFVLHQNEPNPWTSETKISFELPEEGITVLRIYDVSGKEVYNHESVYNAGYHEVLISNEQIGGSGIFMYRLTQSDKELSRRMILVK